MHQLGKRHNSTDKYYFHNHPFRSSRYTNIDRPGFAFSYERKSKPVHTPDYLDRKGSSCTNIHRYSPPRIVRKIHATNVLLSEICMYVHVKHQSMLKCITPEENGTHVITFIEQNSPATINTNVRRKGTIPYAVPRTRIQLKHE